MKRRLHACIHAGFICAQKVCKCRERRFVLAVGTWLSDSLSWGPREFVNARHMSLDLQMRGHVALAVCTCIQGTHTPLKTWWGWWGWHNLRHSFSYCLSLLSLIILACSCVAHLYASVYVTDYHVFHMPMFSVPADRWRGVPAPNTRRNETAAGGSCGERQRQMTKIVIGQEVTGEER
jgi:hypothetical protein